MAKNVSLLGFGEAGMTFASHASWGDAAHVFDIKTNGPATREAKLAEYRACGVHDAINATALDGLVLSLVTAGQALAAARSVAKPGLLFCDMNSVAPGTKRAAAKAIQDAGGRYIDVAVMAPVKPKALHVPLLVSGPDAEAGVAALSDLGFSNVRAVGGDIGQASSIKMIRSVIIKGLEALTAESMLAAHKAGVVEEVLASLGGDWPNKADYNLDRMLVHGLRRAEEVYEVTQTLTDLGIAPLMSENTVAWQQALGELALSPVPVGLTAKLDAIIKSPAFKGEI